MIFSAFENVPIDGTPNKKKYFTFLTRKPYSIWTDFMVSTPTPF